MRHNDEEGNEEEGSNAGSREKVDVKNEGKVGSEDEIVEKELMN